MSDEHTHEPDNDAEPINHGRPLPPEHTRWKPGQSGNLKGRPSAGSSIKEAMNDMAASQLCPAELRAIMNNPLSPVIHIAAARELLLMADGGDLADFEEVMKGNETLIEARSRGVNTALLKKIKRRSRRVEAVGGSKDGENIETEFECDVELRDRAGEHIDRVMDRTDGRPTQSMKVDAVVANTATTLPPEAATNPNVLAAFIELEARLRDAGGLGELPHEE